MPGHPRQLAAIMFADIVGYSALMQSNEQQALAKLNRFKELLETKVSLYRGVIQQFYGDGCLAIFESAVDVVHCAMELQEAFQKEPAVPVRLGIHSGEVFFKENNVFGDAVNIASRVESLGVPGAVLLSSTVRDQIKNKPVFQLISLGPFEFKNIEKSITVYALANDGFPIPKRSAMKGKLKPKNISLNKWMAVVLGLLLAGISGLWLLTKENSFLGTAEFLNGGTPLSEEVLRKRVVVLVFENQTMNPDLDAFGKMISDWVTKGLMETGEANVISAANIQHQIVNAGFSPNDANPEFVVATGVHVILQGRYYLQENRLIIHSNIVDAASGEVHYAMDPIEGPKEKMLDLLDEFTQEVMGYWAVKKQKRYALNPPKYEAWQEWIKGETAFSDDFQNAERHLVKAFELDSTFYAPLLKLIPLYGNRGRKAQMDSIFAFINEKEPPFTQWEKWRFEELKAFSERDYLKAAQNAEKRYQMDKSDDDANRSAAFSYLAANYPKKALLILESFDLRFINKKAGIDLRTGILAMAYSRFNQHERILRIAKDYEAPKMGAIFAVYYLSALVQMDSIDLLKSHLDSFSKSGIFLYGGKEYTLGYNYWYVCREAQLLNKKELVNEYAILLKEWAQKNSHAYLKGFSHYFLKEYEAAIVWFNKALANPTGELNKWQGKAMIGLCQVRMGDKDKALAILQEMDANSQNFVDEFYAKAILQSALGKKADAVASLEQFLEDGGMFTSLSFKGDVLLRPLFGYPPFEELVKPKE